MNKLTIAWLILLLTLAQTLFAQKLSKKCIDELIEAKEESDSDLLDFSKDLVAEVVKVKLQLKIPFGKPADSKVTDIGMTVGCLKAFPEKPNQILPILKEAGLDAAKDAVANKLGANSQPQMTDTQSQVQTQAQSQAQTAAASSPFPDLKECDALFNPEKKFCYDGGVYNKCDGIIYDPTKYICSGEIANRAVCNGVQYNPLIQKCENNAIIAECGETKYDFETHGCENGELFPKCGTTELYDPVTHGCSNNIVLPKCGEILYNYKTHTCKDNTLFAFSKCGAEYYNSETHGCSKNIVFPRCGKTLYNPKTHGCKDNVVFTLLKCGAISYNPATHSCAYDNLIMLSK